MIIIVASPSASGKTTIVSHAIDQFKLHRLITTTTRSPRPEETGCEYHFVAIDEFNKMKSSDAFIECNEVYGNWYGLTKTEVNSNFDKLCIAILDVGGVKTMKSIYGDAVKTIFIMPPSISELKDRLAKRMIDDDSENDRRLAAIEREVADAHLFDYRIYPGELNDVVTEFNTVISKIICPVFH